MRRAARRDSCGNHAVADSCGDKEDCRHAAAERRPLKMKRYLFRAAVAFTVLAVCAGRIALCAEGDSFVVDSPFDLTLGSTNYAARLGKAVSIPGRTFWRGGSITSRIWKEPPAWTCVLQSGGTDICSEHVRTDLREKLLRSHSPPPVLLQGAPFACPSPMHKSEK